VEAVYCKCGTYEIKGSTLTIRPIVAKNVNLMKSSYVQEFKLEGPNTLWLIPTPDNATTEPRIKLTKLDWEWPTWYMAHLFVAPRDPKGGLVPIHASDSKICQWRKIADIIILVVGVVVMSA
jgi:hypothetical protein